MKILPLIIAVAAMLLSCESKKNTTQKTSAGSTADSTSMIADSAATGMNSNSDMQMVSPNAVASNPDQAGKPALNPAHGEPFHRCDIAVGAPIDSAPAPAAAPQMTPPATGNAVGFNTSPISPTASPVQANQATGPKPALNPAHGQPWHKCELQVGAPLT